MSDSFLNILAGLGVFFASAAFVGVWVAFGMYVAHAVLQVLL